jgi:hypothetical protein
MRMPAPPIPAIDPVDERRVEKCSARTWFANLLL